MQSTGLEAMEAACNGARSAGKATCGQEAEDKNMQAAASCCRARLLMLLFAGCLVLLIFGMPGFASAQPVQESYPDLVRDPVYGVQYRWNDLAPPDFSMFHESELRDRRVWARIPLGIDELVYVQSMVPIYADIDPKPLVLGYEEDSGELLKRIGVRALTFGGGSGRLATDYPEIRELLIEQLMHDYVRTLRGLYPDIATLTRLIERSQACDDLDSLALGALHVHGIRPVCQAAPADFYKRP